MSADVFTEARKLLSIPEAWRMLDLEGEPRPSCRSPFREDHTPSFSIHTDGQKWTDHATGDGGDVIEFIKVATGLDHREIRQWLIERLDLARDRARPARMPSRPREATKSINWPSEVIEGSESTWKAFAKKRGFTYSGTWVMIKSGILRFTIIDGIKCFVVTDAARRSAEIRRIDGQPFGDHKAYPLPGVDKKWLVGAAMISGDRPKDAVLVVEGATDLLTAIDLLTRHGKAGDAPTWCPVAILGAGCKQIDPECAKLISGRHVRIVPDADEAGDRMRDHWTELFHNLGCPVDHVVLPRGTDLSDHINTISPTDLFTL